MEELHTRSIASFAQLHGRFNKMTDAIVRKGSFERKGNSWPRSRNARRQGLKVYKRMCTTELCCKESSKVGKTRRGRKKNRSKFRFHWPKKFKHFPLSGSTFLLVDDSNA